MSEVNVRELQNERSKILADLFSLNDILQSTKDASTEFYQDMLERYKKKNDALLICNSKIIEELQNVQK